MLSGTVAEHQAIIPVEKIKGPVLLISATKDEMIPAVEMGEKMMRRFKRNHFQFTYQHIILEGTHAEPTKHFDKIFSFLEENFSRR